MSNNEKYLLRLYLNGLQNRIFTFKKKVNFECQMASVGTWSHSGDFSSECENLTGVYLKLSEEWYEIITAVYIATLLAGPCETAIQNCVIYIHLFQHCPRCACRLRPTYCWCCWNTAANRINNTRHQLYHMYIQGGPKKTIPKVCRIYIIN